jgi:hypothetical protein
LENGAQNVLLVSQSHEAVNNAAERVTSLFSKHDKAVGVVRLGNEGQVSKGLEGAHELAIQDHYRERFRAEYSQRLAALAPALGLEDDFVNLCIDFENGYAKHIERMLATDSVEGDEETADISLARFSRLQRRLNEFFGRAQLNLEVTSFPQLNGIRDEFYSAAIEKYGVASYDSVERLKQISSLANEWLKVMSSSRANFQNFLVRTRNLVCGTCVGVGRAHYGITDNIYDWVVIDEAARSNAGELAIAMQVGRRILLVGDHKQLPPMYEESHIDSAHKRLPGISSGEIRKSDFERGFVSSYGKSIGQTLLHQYRMAPPIGTLVSKCFYDSLLATDRGEADIAFSNFPFESNSCVTWIDTSDLGKGGFEQQSGQGGDTSTTYVNQSEIRCIVNLLRTILVDEALLRRLEEDSVHEPPIGIICMYSGQKQALVKRMNSIPWGRDFIENGIVKIDTVDGYQGKENDVVIVSLVRNNRGGNQGFLSSPERINVALSRAKERLFIVGATSMWSSATKSPLGAVYQHISSSGDGTAYTILSADKLPRMGE